MRHFYLDPAVKDNGGTERVPLIGEVDQTQIDAWKAAHPLGIYKVVSESGHVSYFKNPSRHDVNAALAANKNILDPFEQLAGQTWLGGSAEMKTNDTMFLGVMNAIKDKMDGQRAALVNL